MTAREQLLQRIENFEKELDVLKQDLRADDDFGIYAYLQRHYEDLKYDESIEYAQVLSKKLLHYLQDHFPFIRTEFRQDEGEIGLYLGHWFRAEELGRIDIVHLDVQLFQEVINYLEKYEANPGIFKMNIEAIEEQQELDHHYGRLIEEAHIELEKMEAQLENLQKLPNEKTIFGKPKNIELDNEIDKIKTQIKTQQKEIESLEDRYKVELVDTHNRIVFPELATIDALKLQDFVTSMGYNEIHQQYTTVEQFVYELLSIAEGAYLDYLEQLSSERVSVADRPDPIELADDDSSVLD